MQEDHVSMGWSAGRKLRVAIANLRRILAVELVAAARAIELRAPLRPSPATAAVVGALRETVAGPGPDRFLSPELGAAERFVASGHVEQAVAAATGAIE
jgi:histidine ammonia-lyase